jgi:hypothetical protein
MDSPYADRMDLSHAFSTARWRRMFASEARVRAEALAEGRAPDATVDEVGAAQANVGFDGQELTSGLERGNGTSTPGSPEWSGLGQV